jgi:putative membrane protein
MNRINWMGKLSAAAALWVALWGVGQAGAQNRVNGPDQAIVTRLHQINQDEITMAQLGAARGSDPQLQTFASTMVSDHRAADSKLLSYAADKGMNLDTIARAPSAQAHGTDALLTALNSGGAQRFDYNFANKANADHQAAIDVAQESSRMAKDPELRALIADMLPTLRMHLAMAGDLLRRLPPPPATTVQAPFDPVGASRSHTGADERPGMGHVLLPSP